LPEFAQILARPGQIDRRRLPESGARELAERHRATAYLSGEDGSDWQVEWVEGNPQARFLRGGNSVKIGNISFKAVHRPRIARNSITFFIAA
jgi:hydroxyacylglutathione hydrolase